MHCVDRERARPPYDLEARGRGTVVCLVAGDKLFAIGDVHGCSEALAELIDRLPLDAGSTVVTLGDYVDRGPDSQGVIDLLLELRERVHLVPLRGNHEQLFLDFLDSDDEAVAARFVLNGGGATLRSYAGGIGSTVYVPRAHIEFLRGLHLSYETDDHFFVHAAVPDRPLAELVAERDAHYMTWARRPFLNSSYRWEKMVVHGHSRAADPSILDNRIGLDTGCGFGGRLTAMGFPSRTVYQVRQLSERPPPPREVVDRRTSQRLHGTFPVRVRHPREGVVEMTTVNYSAAGLLLQQPVAAHPYPLGALVDGEIDLGEGATISFRGHIARRYRVKRGVCYGVSILRVKEQP